MEFQIFSNGIEIYFTLAMTRTSLVLKKIKGNSIYDDLKYAVDVYNFLKINGGLSETDTIHQVAYMITENCFPSPKRIDLMGYLMQQAEMGNDTCPAFDFDEGNNFIDEDDEEQEKEAILDWIEENFHDDDAKHFLIEYR